MTAPRDTGNVIYRPYCAEVFLRVAEGVGVPVVARLLAIFVQQRTCENAWFVTLSPVSQAYVTLLVSSVKEASKTS
ncbi:hypothetical protein CVT26_012301 [Gymnopilus dilepis]|uniref:Uncharacterized protein n=1 Tax=Gymnopilus dilepis TaxID=231916 RepID=A0A409YW97_9AGAR|nr:hypothetical protein CVT26_012301 [Gymnopilus dilepis]